MGMKPVGLWALCALFFLAALSVSAERVNVGDLWFEIDASTRTAKLMGPQDGVSGLAEITKVYTQKHVVVPQYVEWNGEVFTVTAIGHFAFGKSEIETISLPPTITLIESNAFEGSKNISKVVFPVGTTDINAMSFRNVASLRQVIWPEVIEKIHNESFSGTSLEQIALPGSVKTIYSKAFKNVPLGDGAYLNEGLEMIEAEAFAGGSRNNPTQLKEIVIPSTVKSIYGHAFQHSLIETLWFEGSPSTIMVYSTNNKVTSFSSMMVNTIIWGTRNRPVSSMAVGVADESTTVLYFDNKSPNFTAIGPSIKVANYDQPDQKVATKSPDRIGADILGALPAVSFAVRELDLNEYIGLSVLEGLRYECSDPEVASIDGSLVRFHKAGVVTITATADAAGERPLVGASRKLCIMPVTVSVIPDEDGNIHYSSTMLSEEEIRSNLVKEAEIVTSRSTDESGQEWMLRYASGAESDCFEFIYGTMPMTFAPDEVPLPDIDVVVHYGDMAIDMADIDAQLIEQGYELSYKSSDESILRVDGMSLVPVGAGSVEVTTLAEGVVFADAGVRQINVGKRRVVATPKDDEIEDDAESIPAVEYEITGLVEGDEHKNFIDSWEWADAKIEEGVYISGSPQIKEDDLYEVVIAEKSASLYVTRAVNRLLADIDFGGKNAMTVKLTGTCRIKVGNSVISGEEGLVTVELDAVLNSKNCRILCDYPERVAEVDISGLEVSRVSIPATLENLEVLNVSRNSLVPGSVELASEISGQVTIISDGQERMVVSIDKNMVSLNGIDGVTTVRWIDGEGRLMVENEDYTVDETSSVYTFLRDVAGVYAELSDGLISITTEPVNIIVDIDGNGDGEIDKPTTSIDEINADPNRLVNVYTLGGVLVKRNVKFSEARQNLASGTYVIGGKLYQVR